MTALEDVNTLDVVAAYLKLPEAVVLRLARTGHLGSLKEGRIRTYPREAVEAYVTSHTIAAVPPNPHGLTDRSLRRVRGTA